MLDSTSSSIHDHMDVGLRGADIKGEFDGGIASAVGLLLPAVLGLAGPGAVTANTRAPQIR